VATRPTQAEKAPVVEPTDKPAPRRSAAYTASELQAVLMGFADNHSARLAQALSMLEENIPDEVTSHWHILFPTYMKVFNSASSYEMAASPNPGGGLLDMAVMVTLLSTVWEDYWVPEVFGEVGENVLSELRRSEIDIWEIAREVMDDQQRQELRLLIEQWRKANPHVNRVSFVRFSDFAESRRKSTLMKAAWKGLFFRSVSEAAEATERIRLFSERAMYLLSRMQLVATFQVELASKEFFHQPEVLRMLNRFDMFLALNERFVRFLESTPGLIQTERIAAIEQAFEGVAKEREGLEGLLSESDDLEALLADVRKTFAAANELAATVDNTVAAVGELLEEHARAQAERPPAKPLDIADIQEVVSEASDALREAKETLESSERMLVSPGWVERADELYRGAEVVDVRVRGILQRAFLLAAGLIVFFFAVLFCYQLAAKRFTRSR